MTNTKSARVGGEYKYVSGKWKMSVWGVGGKWSDKYIYENYFLIILMLMNIPVLLLHICQGGSITF